MNELEQLYEAIKATFQAALPENVLVDWQPDLQDGFNLPAVFFAMTDWVPADDPGTGETVVNGRFQAVILTDPVLEKSALQAAWLSLKLTQVLRAQYWGLDFVNTTTDVKGGPAPNPALEGFEVFGLEWTQEIHIGDIEDWPFPDIVNTPVRLAPAPDEVDVGLVAP